MNPILEQKIISEINNPANTLFVDSRPGDRSFDITRDGKTRIYVLNAWDYGIYKVSVGGDPIISIEGGEKEYIAHPSKQAFESILRACEARYQVEKFKTATAGLETEMDKMTQSERNAYNFLNRDR